jgi:hypothetical protein
MKKQTPNETLRVVTPQELVRSHENNVALSLKQHKLNQSMQVYFPNKKGIPLLGKFGVWLVSKTGGSIKTKYSLVNDTITNESRHKK